MNKEKRKYMITLLFIISFLLHGILLMIVFKNAREKKQWKHANNQETEAILHQFLEDIKHENVVLEQKLSKLSRAEDYKSSTKNEMPSQEESFFSKKSLQKDAETYEPSLQGQVHQLYAAGMPIENIAKQLGRGKAEVELMIKFEGKTS